MNKSERKKSKIKTYIKGLLTIIFVAIIYNFIWKGYIVNPTASDALKDEDGEVALLTDIAKGEVLAFNQLKNGFQVNSVSKGYLGWAITDMINISHPTTNPFKAREELLQFEGDKQLHLILITTNNKKVYKMVAIDKANNEIELGKIPGEQSSLYYTYSTKPFSDTVTYKAYSKKGELLHRE